MSAPLTPDPPLAARALNLSFVLHAPAGSEQVACWLRRQAAARRALERAAPRLSRLEDDVLRRRIVLPPADGYTVDPAPRFVSLCLGPWELLPRVLGLIFDARPAVVTFLDGDAPGLSERVFFRAPARLNLPAAEAFPAWLATVILRPGNTTLHLELWPVASPAEFTARAEDAVRRFVEQWRCPRALWPAPAEDALPEYRGTG